MRGEKQQLMKTRKAVEYRGKTSNGYCYYINTEGEVAIYCKRGEKAQKNKELMKAVHEILTKGKDENLFIWQWYTVPIWDN